MRLLLVFVLSFGVSVQSSRAMLPEIVVGGTVLFQAAQVISALLPQLATLGASIAGLATASKEATSTLGKLIDQIFPHQRAAAKPPKATGPILVPTISGPTDAPAPSPSADSAPATAETTGELSSKLSELVTAYRARTQPSARQPSAPQASATRASSTRGEASYETLCDQTTESLIETVRGGDKKSLDGFATAVQKLDLTDRPAVLPVLEAVVTKGARFARIHGDAHSTTGFAKLKALHDGVK